MKAIRSQNIDLIKIIAMFCVIGLHSTYSYVDTYMGNILYRTSVIAIPLFFMVSGYLVLAKKDVNYNYIFRKCFGIIKYVFLITTVVWIVFGNRTISDYLKTTFGCYLQKGIMGIFWYFGAMLLIYFMTPILNKILYLHNRYFSLL